VNVEGRVQQYPKQRTSSSTTLEARDDPAREATTVVIGIHPFVVGTPDGAAALRRVLGRLKTESSLWLTQTEAICRMLSAK
jgi:allantoinase